MKVSRIFRRLAYQALQGSLAAVAVVTLTTSSQAAPSGPTLVDALLLIESEHQPLCGSSLTPEATRQRLAVLAGAVGAQMQAHGARADTAVQALNGIVFGPGGIRSSQDLHDPCNLLLSGVLARSQGYCVGVAGVYLILAEELGLPIRAVATPTHVFLRYEDGNVSINIDPMNQGSPVPDEQYISQQRIAQESIRKGVFLKPMSQDQFLAQVHNNLGVIYSERKDYAVASREYEAALRLDKHLPAAWYNQGKMLAEQKDFRGAVRSLSKALRLHPNDTWALNNRGMTYKSLGKMERARRDFVQALRVDPSFDQARSNLAGLDLPP